MSKSNLAKRVEKAKQLRFAPLKIKDSPEEFNTRGSKDDHYVLSLTSREVKIYPRGGGERTITAFFAFCNKHAVGINNPYIVDIQPCRGNCDHTVCYHAIGKIIHAYRGTDKDVCFFEDFNEADDFACYKAGDKLVKIFNDNRRSYIWMVVRSKSEFRFYREGTILSAETKEQYEGRLLSTVGKADFSLSAKDNIQLMRGDEDDEGID